MFVASGPKSKRQDITSYDKKFNQTLESDNEFFVDIGL